MLDDYDTPPEHVFEQLEPDEGAWKELAHDVSARDTAVAATALSSTPSIPVSAPVTSVVTVHAPLLVLTNAPNAALPSRVTLVTTATISNALARATTTLMTAVASTSRVRLAAAPTVIVAFLWVLSDLRRIYVALRACHFMRRSAFELNRIVA